jgi:hypothetical protein
VRNIFAIVCDPSSVREYPWGRLEIDNEMHSDFRRLQRLVFDSQKIIPMRKLTQCMSVALSQQLLSSHLYSGGNTPAAADAAAAAGGGSPGKTVFPPSACQQQQVEGEQSASASIATVAAAVSPVVSSSSSLSLLITRLQTGLWNMCVLFLLVYFVSDMVASNLHRLA